MNPEEQKRRMELPEDFPTEIIQPMARLWRRREKLIFRMLPRDAYMIAALLQFANRNPALTDEHQEVLRDFANQLIAAVANIEPIMEPYLLLGWNPEHDQPARDKEK